MTDVELIPILNDNYAYLLQADNGGVAIVDPGESAPILEKLKSDKLTPDTIFITHYHGDHVGGLDDILAVYADIRVIGKEHENVAALSFGGENVEVIQTPGHKRDHVCFYFPESGFVLSGDTLFAMGCGRILDGSADALFDSLQKLCALPDDCAVYCGHEYTLSNAQFCAHIQPDNEDIAQRLATIQALRDDCKPTIPSSIGLEKRTNVFLQVKSAAEFATLRDQKDNF